MSRQGVDPDHETWADSVGAYLLGALPEDEQAPFEEHLAVCKLCADEAELLRIATDALPASPRQLTPPPALKDRIMAVVDSEAELLRAAGPDADRVTRTKPAGRVRPSRWSMRPGIAIAMTAAGLVAGVATGIVLERGSGAPQERVVVAKVTAADASAGAGARLIVRDDHSTLVTQRMPPPGAGRVYQVWLKRAGRAPEPTNALFGVSNDGSASVDVPGSLDAVDQVLVTSEPDGGSTVPTRQPVISAVVA